MHQPSSCVLLRILCLFSCVPLSTTRTSTQIVYTCLHGRFSQSVKFELLLVFRLSDELGCLLRDNQVHRSRQHAERVFSCAHAAHPVRFIEQTRPCLRLTGRCRAKPPSFEDCPPGTSEEKATAPLHLGSALLEDCFSGKQQLFDLSTQQARKRHSIPDSCLKPLAAPGKKVSWRGRALAIL